MSSRRAVLVGCGMMSDAWLRALDERRDVSVLGLVDVVPE